jgi:filamentous hemagglutinin
MASPSGHRRGPVAKLAQLAILTLVPWLATRAATLPVPCIGGACGLGVAGFVTAGAASAALSGARLTVTQTSANATLNWQSFNISKDGTVQFVQPSASAVALNRIWDSSPSQIFGALNANGRVFLINQNGIVFGAGAQVNVGGLLVSSLDMNPAAQSGLLNAGQAYQPAFQPFANGKASGAVSIGKGATLATSSGGQILVFAPEITNEGTIQSPGGQTVLAAGNTIYLASSTDPTLRGLLVEVGGVGGTVTNGDGADSAVKNPAQLVGQILAKDGNVTLAGLAVNQLGRISATTSINENGSIYLEATDHGAVQSAGSGVVGLTSLVSGGALVLGPGSDTEVTLDTSDPSTTVDSVAQPKSAIEMSGKTIDMLSGSLARATSGTINVTAQKQFGQALTYQSDGSRFYLAPGAEVDVSGATTVLPVSSNVIPVQLHSTELANSPEQRNGPLQEQTVYVDVRQHGQNADGSTWWGTPLADVSGEIAAIAHNVIERNLTGGTVTVHSQGDVILSATSTVNLAGGYIQYTGGYLDTTKLRTTGGQIVDIGSASPDVHYTGIVSSTTVADPKWGVSNTYAVMPGTYQPGYREGKDAGTLNLSAPSFVFDSHVDGATVTGQYQRQPDTPLVDNTDPDNLYRSPDEVPLPATLNVGGSGELNDLVVGNITVASEEVPPSLLNADGSAFDPLTDPLPASYTASILDANLIGAGGFGNVNLAANGAYLQPANVALELPPGGTYSVQASKIDIEGSIDAPAGTISAAAGSNVTDSSEVSLKLGPSASLVADGQWVNDNALLYPSGNTAPLYISGGSVSLTASISSFQEVPSGTATIDLAPGSLIDVSAGARVTQSGELIAGTGGSIHIGAETPASTLAGKPPELTLESSLRGYALFDGGQLSITASAICIAASDCSGGNPSVLWLSPAALASGGFSSYQLTAEQGGLTVEPGTTVTLQQQNLALPTHYSTLPNAASLIGIATPTLLPDWVRRPADLSLMLDFPATTTGTVSGIALLELTPQYPSLPPLLVGSGAVIRTDPGGDLTLSSNTSLIDEGTLRAPGGSIALNLLAGDPNDVQNQYIASQAIWLAGGAVLDASGLPVTYTDTLGLTVGQVLDGGTVSLTAQRGYIELLPGSDINVAGSSATLNVTPPGGLPQRERVASAGGTIDLAAAEGMSLGGSFQASAGTPGPGVRQPAGGTLSLTMDAQGRNDFADVSGGPQTFPTDARQILVSQTLPPSVVAPGASVPDWLAGEALVPATTLEDSGFDIVSLKAARIATQSTGGGLIRPGVIAFEGNVHLTAPQEISLDAGTYSVSAGAIAQIQAPYVEFGNSDVYSGDPMATATSGTGTLEVSGGFVELYGSSVLEGVGTASFRSSGDLRLRGVQAYRADLAPQSAAIAGGLYGSGTINLDAAQIYPTTLSQFTISADPASLANPTAGAISISGRQGADKDLLSAGGALTLSAATVTQDGVLRAPFGTITIDAQTITLADGSLTSTSSDGLTIPFGQTQGGLNWVYTLQAEITTLYGAGGAPPPSQHVQLQGENVDVQSGATVDIAGGGDLQAYEWVNGPGGTVDVLSQAARPQQFAILPDLKAQVAPYDPVESLNSPLQPGDAIDLAGGSGLPAGTYILMPARYALLPGAYVVSAVSGYQNIAPGESFAAPDGGTIVSGYRTVSGLSIGGSLNSAFDVTPASIVDQQAQYTLTSGNAFFASQGTGSTTAAPLPQDSGLLQLSATDALTLNGTLLTAPATGGLGAAVDISSADIVVTGGETAAMPGVLEVSSASLDQLGAQSLLIGGDRSDGSVETTAQNVTLANGADLTVPQLLLTAQQNVTVAGGASIHPTGSAPAGRAYSLSGDGAFMSVSTGTQIDVSRSGATASAGLLSLAPGSSLSAAQGSIYLDATQEVSTEGSIAIAGGDLAVQAPQIALGNVPATLASTVTALGPNVLGAGGLRNLLLDSGSTLDVYGGASAAAQNIALEATGLDGLAAAGDTATLTASGTLSLSNPQGSTAGVAGSGTGSLILTASSIAFDGGTLTVTGFGSVSLEARNAVTGAADGGLTTTGDLAVSATRITTDSGASLDLSALGATTLASPSTRATLPAATGLGGSLSVSGSSIEVATQLDLPSGEVTLATSGSGPGAAITLDNGGAINVAGIVRQYDGVNVASPGGTVTLASAADVELASGSSIDVSAGAGGAGGTLSFSAPNGTVTASGTLTGSGASGQGASFAIDAQGFDFQALDQTLNAGGFSGSRSFRLRGTVGGGSSNDLVVASGGANAIVAHTVSLEADQGSIGVDGLIDASGSTGGAVTLAAANGIAVNGTIDARATSAGEAGGTVELDLESPAGQVVLGSGSSIDVSGGGPGANGMGAGGTVLLRAPQQTVADLATGGTAIALDGTITGASQTVLEGFKTYQNTTGVISATDMASMQADANAFMTPENESAILAQLAPSAAWNLTLEPGVEIDATAASNGSGNLEIDTAWNLYGWRFEDASGVADVPGILTLRATGSITFNASLSDGFAATSGTGAFTLPTTPSNSWSYRIVAGADPTAADPLTVNDATSQDVTIAGCLSSCTPYETDLITGAVYAPNMVRTGNGFIDVSASGNFVLGSQASMLYTAGVAGPGIDLSGFTHGSGDARGRAYPVDGGSINIDVGRDVVGAQTDQLVNAWLWRLGETSGDPTGNPTAWTVDFQSFQQGVAALGGGNVSVRAGGDITDLSVSIPSIGEQVGGTTQAASSVDVVGGGHLSINAGGSILAGSYYVGLGSANLTAGDDIGSVPLSAGGTGLSPIIALGDATVDVTARANAQLSGILDPTLLNIGEFQSLRGASATYFSTYGTDSSLTLTAVGGDVTLNNDDVGSSTLADSFFFPNIQGNSETDGQGGYVALDVIPPTLNAYAFGGNIDLGRDLLLWPSATGNLQLFADQSVVASASNVALVVSDADPALLPSPAAPQGGAVMSTFSDLLQGLTSSFPDQYAALPVHQSEDRSGLNPVRVVALTGDVSFSGAENQTSGIWSAKPVSVVAGADIENLDLIAENLSPSDVTSVTAGGSITYPLTRNAFGNVLPDSNQIAVDGPGELQITAGGTIDLGTSGGVVTRANLVNPNLPSQGASISLEAGIAGGSPQYTAFISQYIDHGSQFDSELTTFVQDLTGASNLTTAQAKQTFDAMGLQLQRTFVEQLFFDLIRKYGSAEAASGNGDFSGAFQAIAALFPGAGAKVGSGKNPYSGNISLYFSRVYTEQGGGISMLAPGGSIDVGLAIPPSGFGLPKLPDQLGIVAQASGDVNAFASDGFEVNESRVFAADGGDILAWTTFGDIDAGRGAKTSISAPSPNIVYDLNGQPTVTFRAPIAGSGIQALAATPGVTPGHVYLFAPNGVVNANEAGIVAGSLTVAATAVLGTNNISVSGTTVGVPVAVTGLGASFSGAASAAAGATNTAVSTAAKSSGPQSSNEPLANEAVNFLQVFITGLGEENCSPDDVACLQRESQQQNPAPQDRKAPQ